MHSYTIAVIVYTRDSKYSKLVEVENAITGSTFYKC